jgi:hypothetical protein
MPTTVSLSRALLTLAAWVAPPNRQTMCQAMRAELDVLGEGRLSWALGGLASAVGWRVRIDGLFWGVVLACSLPIWAQVTMPAEVPIYNLLDRLGSPAIYGYWLLQQALLAALLTTWRPRLGLLAAILCLIVKNALVTFMAVHVYHSWTSGKVEIMDASPIVGVSAILGWTVAGAWAGATIRRMLTKPSPAGLA